MDVENLGVRAIGDVSGLKRQNNQTRQKRVKMEAVGMEKRVVVNKFR